MQINLKPHELENTGITAESSGGVAIHIDGYKGNPQEVDEETTQIFIERYEGRVQIHVWNDTQDPVTFVLSKQERKDD